MRISKHAFSMIELMVGVCIFALAILPLIWLSSKQTSGAFHVGKHMMAGQLAASYMDNIIHRDYKEILEIKDSIRGEIKGKVLEPPDTIKHFMDLKSLAESLDNEKANENIQSSFKFFRFKITITENADEMAIRVKVDVSYLVNESKKNDSITDDKKATRQFLSIQAIKYGEKND